MVHTKKPSTDNVTDYLYEYAKWPCNLEIGPHTKIFETTYLSPSMVSKEILRCLIDREYSEYKYKRSQLAAAMKPYMPWTIKERIDYIRTERRLKEGYYDGGPGGQSSGYYY